MAGVTSVVDAAAARGALRKASWRLLPLFAVGYAIAYMDRVNISFAAETMNRALGLSATVYGFGAGLFFLAYAACEIPSNLMLHRFGARRWLARIMITWGLVALCMVWVRRPWEFYVVRFALGMAEAGFFPGVVFYLTQWFPAEERGRAVSRFYVALPLSSVVMGGLAGSLLGLNGRLGLAGWQWLFALEALPALVMGVVILCVLPDGPRDAPWLTEAERAAVVAQLGPAEDAEGRSLGEVFRDSRVLLLGGVMFAMLAASYAYSFSAPLLLRRLTGWTAAEVGYVIAGIGIVGALSMVASGVVAHRWRASYGQALVCCVLIGVGFLMFGVAHGPRVAFAGLLCIAISYYAMQPPLWGISAGLFSGRQAAGAIATMNTLGILGGFVGPYWMGYAKDLTGSYQVGMVAIAPVMVCAGGVLGVLWWRERAGVAREAMALRMKAAPEAATL